MHGTRFNFKRGIIINDVVGCGWASRGGTGVNFSHLTSVFSFLKLNQVHTDLFLYPTAFVYPFSTLSPFRLPYPITIKTQISTHTSEFLWTIQQKYCFEYLIVKANHWKSVFLRPSYSIIKASNLDAERQREDNQQHTFNRPKQADGRQASLSFIAIFIIRSRFTTPNNPRCISRTYYTNPPLSRSLNFVLFLPIVSL